MLRNYQHSALCACLGPVKALPQSLCSSHQPHFICFLSRRISGIWENMHTQAVVIRFLLAYPSICSHLSKFKFPKWSTLGSVAFFLSRFSSVQKAILQVCSFILKYLLRAYAIPDIVLSFVEQLLGGLHSVGRDQ